MTWWCLQPVLQQIREQRVELRRIHHFLQWHALVDHVRGLLVAWPEADRRNTGLARPVGAVGREVPRAQRTLLTPQRFDGLLSCLHYWMRLV